MSETQSRADSVRTTPQRGVQRVYTVGSLFSGVGGFDMGFVRAGFDVRWQCEIDRDCRDVLCKRFPETDVIYSDIRTMPLHQVERVDVLIGGFPCQDLSVAGRRAGLDGERSGLFFEFARVIGELRPAFVVMENVPGLLSSNGGKDMAVVLGTLRDIGAHDIAWGVLDAQWFGVPQRRRRVFIVCDFAGERAAEILALSEGLQGHPAPRRETGEDVAGSIGFGSGSGGKHRYDLDGHDAYIAGPLTNRYHKGVNTTMDDGALVTHSLTANGCDASEDGTGRGTPLVAFAQNQRGELRTSAIAPQLTMGGGKPGQGYPAVVGPLMANAATARKHGDGGISALDQYLSGHIQPSPMGVRRLTPTECERLMGWPDDHTRYGISGKEMSDSTRYRMCGNGVVSNVSEWIARAILAAEGVA